MIRYQFYLELLHKVLCTMLSNVMKKRISKSCMNADMFLIPIV